MFDKLITRLTKLLDKTTTHLELPLDDLTDKQANQVLDFIEHSIDARIKEHSQQPEDCTTCHGTGTKTNIHGYNIGPCTQCQSTGNASYPPKD